MSLIINGLNVSYGKNHILKDVNLSINSGEFVSVLGKSGCGKTTLIKSIAGLLDTDNGDMSIFDEKFDNVYSNRPYRHIRIFEDMIKIILEFI